MKVLKCWKQSTVVGQSTAYLLAFQGHLGGGAHGHFRLAEAHVTHQQPVHGTRRLQVSLHRLDGSIWSGVGEGEAGVEGRHVRPAGGIGVALLSLRWA
ncbi:MAG: hypothetical protein IPP58_01920 [Holophagaceae bacterium]|uniref:Uncharacterized protein n=1 Tax=Candidatus Geothrix skivensis TaxID=2954439 RepID=A0A9D7SEW8_9BACT|nr:hypothetical protein [Candidatus Geothrix skivensis]